MIRTLDIGELVKAYEEGYLKANGRELRVNHQRLEWLRRVWGPSTNTLTLSDLERAIYAMDRSSSTRNRFRSLVSHMLKWSQERGLVEGDIPKLKFERENGARTRRMTKDEQQRLLLHMGTDMRNMFYAALDTGLRRGALLQLQFRDIREGAIVVPAAIQKHRRAQVIPLTSRLKAIIERRKTDKDDKIFDFTPGQLRRMWDNARHLAGVEGLRWHDLRGEFASRLDEAGVEVSVTSQLLGHASLSMTQKYLRPRVERFRDAIDKLGV